MIRIGKMADYALLLTNHLVNFPEQLTTTEQLVEATQLPFATVRKLLKQLVDGKIVQSYRGTKGGYRLLRAAAQINVAEVIMAIEGPIALTDCVLPNHKSCGREEACGLKENWSYINTVVTNVFRGISLEDMTKHMAGNSKQVQLDMDTKEICLSLSGN